MSGAPVDVTIIWSAIECDGTVGFGITPEHTVTIEFDGGPVLGITQTSDGEPDVGTWNLDGEWISLAQIIREAQA